MDRIAKRIMRLAQTINLTIKRECDRQLIIKLRAIMPHTYDDLAGLARRFLHAKADEFIAEHNLDLSTAQTQPVSAERNVVLAGEGGDLAGGNNRKSFPK